MRKHPFFFTCMILAAGPPSARGVESVIPQVDQLIAQKKYLSAFDLLEKQKAGDDDPEIALKKADVALTYFASSIMHKMFAFKDLKPGEDILAVRGSSGKFEMFTFDIEEVFSKLIKTHPKDHRLRKQLADYHLDVFEKYDEWEKSKEELLKSARENYDAAITMGAADAETHFRAGKVGLYMDDLPYAAGRLRVAVQKKKDHYPAHYNLAYAALFDGKASEAAGHAVTAYEGYTEKSLKADAAMLAGEAYFSLKKHESALKYYLLCEKLAPKKFENLRRMVRLYVVMGKKMEARATGERIFDMDPTNPTTAQVFLKCYLDSPIEGELPGIFNGLAQKYAKNDEAAGNALFHLAFYYREKGEKASALKVVDEAEKRFVKAFKKDHQVFQAIKDMRAWGGKE